jgi:hypothetical protein
VLEPDHHTGVTHEGHDVDAGDAVKVDLAGKQLKAQVDRCPGGLRGAE